MNLPLAGVAALQAGDSPAAGFAARLIGKLGADVVLGVPATSAQEQDTPERQEALAAYLDEGKKPGSLEPGQLSRMNIVISSEDDRALWERRLAGYDLPALGRVMLFCTPYGLTGPKSRWQATELTLSHAGGEGFLMPSGLAYELFPDRPPLRSGNHVAHYQGGLTAALAAIAGLRRSRRNKATEWVDVSIQEAQLSLNHLTISRLVDGVEESRAARAFRYGGVLECQDGYISILTLEQSQWEGLRKAIGNPEWSRDSEMADPIVRASHGAEINKHLRNWAAMRTKATAVAELHDEGVPVGPYLAPEELAAVPQLQHRGFFSRVNERWDQPGIAWTLTEATAGITTPRAGQGDSAGLAQRTHMEDRPLAGIRVVDFCNHAAGPFCGLMLALLGCDVIRIESRRRLDIGRRPHPVYGRLDVPSFDHLAGHKRSVTLDLKTTQGAEIAKELVAASDVVIENFRPGVMKRLGLDWGALSQVNERLVMLSLSAYGQTGPDSRRPGYAPIFAAEGGLGFLTGYPDGPPCEVRNNMDHQAGLTGALVVVALLESAARSKRGSYADLAARDVAAMMVGESIISGQVHGPSQRIGNSHLVLCPHGVYPAHGKDRWIAIAVRSDDEWNKLVAHMGHPGWCTAAMQATTERKAREPLVDQMMSSWTEGQDPHQLASTLQSLGIPAEASMSAADLLSDEHLRHRGAIAEVSHPARPSRRTVDAPWRFAGMGVSYAQWSPELGEHNEEVLREVLGYTPARIEDLTSRRVLF